MSGLSKYRYRCSNCGCEFEKEYRPGRTIRCPSCSHSMSDGGASPVLSNIKFRTTRVKKKRSLRKILLTLIVIGGIAAGTYMWKEDIPFPTIGELIPIRTDFFTSPTSSSQPRPKCADSFILLDFNEFPALTNMNITVDWGGKVHSAMSREEMDKYRFTMTVGDVYLSHSYGEQSRTTTEYQYLGGGVMCKIHRHFDPDYVDKYKYRMHVGSGLGSRFFCGYNGPMGDRSISTVVYEVLPRMIVFKITQITDKIGFGYEDWWPSG